MEMEQEREVIESEKRCKIFYNAQINGRLKRKVIHEEDKKERTPDWVK